MPDWPDNQANASPDFWTIAQSVCMISEIYFKSLKTKKLEVTALQNI